MTERFLDRRRANKGTEAGESYVLATFVATLLGFRAKGVSRRQLNGLV